MNLEIEAKKLIEIYVDRCNKSNLFTSAIVRKDFNFEFSVEESRNKIKVLVYFGKKGVKTILQGDLNSNLHEKLNDLLIDQTELNLKKQTLNEPEEYIGSDECGKGDFFGPLVTAAVYIDKDLKIKLRNIGVRDSKDLNENQIAELSRKILSLINGNYELIKINPSKYNELYDKFKNLNKLLNWAHSKAIDSLLQKTDCKTVLTDKFSNRDLHVSNNTNHVDVEFIQETQAEKYVGVAAASIIARHEFNRWFIEQKKSGFDLPKGSSKIVEDAAAKLMSKIHDNTIGNFAKLHFKTFKKIK